jgi:hypothetical protein
VHQRAISDFIKVRQFTVSPHAQGYMLQCEAQPAGFDCFQRLQRDCQDARHVAQLFESLVEQHIWNCPQDQPMLNEWRAQFAHWYREPSSALHFEDADSQPFLMQPVM